MARVSSPSSRHRKQVEIAIDIEIEMFFVTQLIRE